MVRVDPRAESSGRHQGQGKFSYIGSPYHLGIHSFGHQGKVILLIFRLPSSLSSIIGHHHHWASWEIIKRSLFEQRRGNSSYIRLPFRNYSSGRSGHGFLEGHTGGLTIGRGGVGKAKPLRFLTWFRRSSNSRVTESCLACRICSRVRDSVCGGLA